MTITQRTFIPGSKWVYIKIYTGISTSDIILTQVIPCIIKKLENIGVIDKWFFVRYSDPDTHLRLRILLKNESDFGLVLSIFYAKCEVLVSAKLIWKIQLDTYNREIERYSDKLIEEAETLFYIDSECVLTILQKINKIGNENYRWMIAIKIIDNLLSLFSLNIYSKAEMMNELSDSFKTEFGFNKFNSKQFNLKYRKNKFIINDVINNVVNEKDFLFLLLILKEKTDRMKVVVDSIVDKSNNTNFSLNNLIKSYIHMSLNRIFRSRNRLHELVIYDFLYRFYSSEIAKIKYNSKN